MNLNDLKKWWRQKMYEEDPTEYCALLKTSTEITYNSIKSIYCPALSRNIIFNAKGFHHLSYKPDGTARKVPARIYKLTLFPLVIPVIKNALKIDEKRNIFVSNSRKKNAKPMKAIQYALVSEVGKLKTPVKVILMEIEGGKETIFWSVMKN